MEWMEWIVESHNRPPDFETVLLELTDGKYTTGWYSSGAKAWIGLAMNQSPPTYELRAGAVKRWRRIASQ